MGLLLESFQITEVVMMELNSPVVFRSLMEEAKQQYGHISFKFWPFKAAEKKQTFFAFHSTWRWQWLHVIEKVLFSSSAETTTKWQTSAAWKHLWPSLTIVESLIWLLGFRWVTWCTLWTPPALPVPVKCLLCVGGGGVENLCYTDKVSNWIQALA